MQMVWKKKNKRPRPLSVGLPFEPASPERQETEKRNAMSDEPSTSAAELRGDGDGEAKQYAQRLQDEGNTLAEEGKYVEALRKWEAAIVLTPGSALLHEQKSQVLMELGRTWAAVQAATRATELQPSWPEAWVTLSRAQLNYGEPALAVTSSRTALQLKPSCQDAQTAFETAQRLTIKQRHMSYVGVAAATRLAVGGIQSTNAGNTRRAVVVDEASKPSDRNLESRIDTEQAAADPGGADTRTDDPEADEALTEGSGAGAQGVVDASLETGEEGAPKKPRRGGAGPGEAELVATTRTGTEVTAP